MEKHNNKLAADVIDEYLAVSDTNALTSIVKPLNRLDIIYFLFVRRFSNGQQLELTNYPDWSRYFYLNDYFKMAPFRNPYMLYDKGYYLWKYLGCKQLHNKFLEMLNIGNGITLVYKHASFNDFYHFASYADKAEINNFYLTNINLLNRFILYFQEKSHRLILQAKKSSITLPYQDEKTELFQTRDAQILKFLQETEIQNYYVCDDDYNNYLTCREMECLKWFSRGKTAEEIGIILGTSRRTVETHILNVKRKLNCYKQATLGYKYAMMQMPLINGLSTDYDLTE